MLLRLAIPFGLSAIKEETTIPLATDIHAGGTFLDREQGRELARKVRRERRAGGVLRP